MGPFQGLGFRVIWVGLNKVTFRVHFTRVPYDFDDLKGTLI